MQFLRVSRKKTEIFPAGQNLFLVLYMIVYQSALIPRKLPNPKKFLVTRLTLKLMNFSAFVNSKKDEARGMVAFQFLTIYT